MKKKYTLKPNPISFVFSLMLGLLLLLTLIVSFLRFAQGSFLFAFFVPALIVFSLSIFIAWVEIEEFNEEKEKKLKDRRSVRYGRGA
jgi:energy-coupling factor transporter transmembrane protein EcfT